MSPTVTDARTPAIDLLAVSGYRGNQPHEQFAWLRDNDPVHWHDEPNGPGFWAVTRYEDVRTVSRDHRTFSSSPSVMLETSESETAFGDRTMMITADPPLHTRMRRLVSQRFAPRTVMPMRARIRELANLIIDEVADEGACDLVGRVAGEMPSFVIAEVLGIPLDDGRELYQHTELIHSSEEVVANDDRRTAVMTMFGYAAEVYAEKRAEPGDDLASFLAHATLDDRQVDEVDFFLWFLLLVDAGGDTTRNLIGAGVYALLQHPEQLAWLRDDLDGRLAVAVEELLRYVSPVVYMRRTATVDTELSGQPIAAGDKVVVYYGSANRDPGVFEDAQRLVLDRHPNPHLAFGGGGPHLCLGAHLARVEIEEMLRATIARLGDLTLAGEATWMASNFVFGPASMPVSYRV